MSRSTSPPLTPHRAPRRTVEIMERDSETDSDSEIPKQDIDIEEEISLSGGPQQPDISAAEALLAMREIQCLDLSAVRRDTALHDDILAAANSILRFLDDANSPSLSEIYLDKVLVVFLRFVDVDFLSVLFDHRQVFYSIAAQSASTTNSSTILVCWVDVVLAKLSLLSLNVAGGLSPKLHGPLIDYRERDCVQAATQLPDNWRSVMPVVGSSKTSPAAKRLALRLVYAAYVLGPQLRGENPWAHSGNSIRPQEVLDSLLSWTNQSFLNGFPTLPSMCHINDHDRTSYAMELTDRSQAAQTVLRANEPQSPMRPRSLGNLLNMILFLLEGSHDALPLDRTPPLGELDLAQIILMRWGNLVPWCWTTWSDQRIANVECITRLTATWLYHLGSSLFKEVDLQAFPGLMTKLSLTTLSAQDRLSSSTAFLQLIHDTIIRLRKMYNPQRPGAISPPLIAILFKACWATTQLLFLGVDGIEPWAECLIPQFCSCVLGLFCILGDEEEELHVKDLVLEGLTLIQPPIFRLCLKRIQEDPRFQFNLRIHEAVVRTRRKLVRIVEDGPRAMPPCDVLDVKSILTFLTIAWHNKAEDYIFYETVSSLFASVVAILKKYTYDSPQLLILGDTLLTALSTLEYHHGRIDATQEVVIWNFVLRSDRSRFALASSFAHRLVAAEQIPDQLCYAEAWDYLRDVLLLVLDQRSVVGDEALALSICPVLCVALMKILLTDPATLSCALTSPWTMNLCLGLRLLVDAGGETPTLYSTTLRQRLKGVGKLLLDCISQQLVLPEGPEPTVVVHSCFM